MATEHLQIHAPELLDDLYAAFAAPVPTGIEGCPCCTDPARLQRLLEVPLRDLSAADLEEYTASVFNTIDGTDFRYFWPRIVELALRNELEVDREVVFDKPRRAEWRTEWTDAQQRVMERLATTIVRTLVSTNPDVAVTDSWICAIGRFVDDITTYLDPLLEDDPRAAATFRPWYELNAPLVPRWRLANTWWGHHPNADRLRDWFERPDVIAAAARGTARR